MYLAILIVVSVLILLHVLGEKLSERIERYHTELLSFGAGLMVGIFFLEILPHIAIGEGYLGSYIYVALLAGFVTIHLLEKIVYKQAASEDEAIKDTIRFEAAGLLAYGLLVGILIVVFFDTYGNLVYFLLAPFYVRSFAVSVYAKHIAEKIGSILNHLLQYISPIIGVLVGLFLIEN